MISAPPLCMGNPLVSGPGLPRWWRWLEQASLPGPVSLLEAAEAGARGWGEGLPWWHLTGELLFMPLNRGASLPWWPGLLLKTLLVAACHTPSPPACLRTANTMDQFS